DVALGAELPAQEARTACRALVDGRRTWGADRVRRQRGRMTLPRRGLAARGGTALLASNRREVPAAAGAWLARGAQRGAQRGWHRYAIVTVRGVGHRARSPFWR